MGVIAYTVWCVTVATTVAGLGIGMVLQRFIPNLRAEGKHDEAEGMVGATTRLSVLAAIVGALLLFCWLYWPGSSAVNASSRTSPLALILLVLAWFICWRLADVYLNYLKGEQRFGEFATLTTLSALIRVVVIALGAWLFGVAGALAGYLAGYVVPATRFRRLLRKKPTLDQELRRRVVSFALKGWAVAVISGLVFGRTEIVFLEHYAGIGVVGLFAVAATLTEVVVQLPGLLLSALLPYFSEQHGLGARDRMLRLYRTMTGLLALAVVPLCIGMASIAPLLVPLLFGVQFAGAAPAAAALLIAAAVSSSGAAAAYLISSTGKNGILLISNALGLVGTVALGFLLIPRFGLMGAAWSRVIVQVSVVAIEIWYATRRLGFAPPYRALGGITLAAVIQGVVAHVITTTFGGILSLVAAILAAVLVFLIALRSFAVIPMLDPFLIDDLATHAPGWMRRGPIWVLKLVSRSPKDRSAPE